MNPGSTHPDVGHYSSKTAWSKRLSVSLLLVVFSLSLNAKDVVVASYNLENYLKMERRVDGKTVPDAPKPEEETAAAIEVLKQIQPDILGIVEMGDVTMLEDFQRRLKSAGMDYPHREWVKGADPERHLALLSKYPITARDSIDDVPFELNGTRQRVGRGILDVTVQLSDSYKLRLVGAHLKSRRQVPEFDEKAMRAKEAALFRKHLDGILAAEPDANVLLFGDLNDTKNEQPIRELIGATGSPLRMRDLFLTDRQGLRWTHFWSAADIYSRIDYLLVSNGLWPEIVMDRSGISNARNWYKASDHRAIHTTIRVPEK